MKYLLFLFICSSFIGSAVAQQTDGISVTEEVNGKLFNSPQTDDEIELSGIPEAYQFFGKCLLEHEHHGAGEERGIAADCNELFTEDELGVMPVKRIRTRVHIMLNNHGSNNGQGSRNFPNTSAGRALVEDIINEANTEILAKMRVHATANFAAQPFRDSKLRLEVTGIEYHEATDWDLDDCDRGINVLCTGQLNDWYDTYSGSAGSDDDEMHLFFAEDANPTISSGRGRAYWFNAPRWDLMANVYYSYVNGGITTYDAVQDEMTPYQVFNSPLSSHRAKAVTVDNHGNTWMGFHSFGTANDNVIMRFDGTNFTNYFHANSSATANAVIPGRIVSAIAVEPITSTFDWIWVGTEDGGLVRFDGVTWQPFNMSNSNLPSDRILDIKIEERSGNNAIWIATDAGLVVYEYNNNGFQVINTNNSGIPNNEVQAIGVEYQQAANAAIWVATDALGVARMNGNNWTIYNTANTNGGLVSDVVNCITVEQNTGGGNVVWLGTSPSGGSQGGLSRFENSIWSSFGLNDGFPVDRGNKCSSINDIEVDQNGDKWMALNRGIVRFDDINFLWRNFGNTYNDNYTPASVVPAPDEIGLAGNHVLDVAVDPSSGEVWAASMAWGGGWHQSVGGGNRAAASLTIHELGHNFGLAHSFSDAASMNTPGGKGQTNNVMDYASAIQKGLSQPQLDVWHDRAMLNFGTVGLTVIQDWCDYDLAKSIEIPPNTTVIVDGGPKFMHGDLIVKNGAHLIVNCSISFPEGASLHVEQGGTLTIDGGTLTNSCPDQLWEGVQLYGTRISQQQPFNTLLDPNHGSVFIRNLGTIEHSRFGITTHKIGEALTQGGRIFADNGLFLNNRFSVEFLPFEFENVSYFRNCRFECNGPLQDSNYQTGGRRLGTATHLRMAGVNGVELTDNLFINSGNFDPDLRGLGIASYDASYTVNGKCLSYGLNGCTNLANAFVNLRRGIQFEGSSNLISLEVNECLFANCSQGVYLKGGGDNRLSDNEFTGLAYQSFPGGTMEGWGVYLEDNGDSYLHDNSFAPPVVTTLQPARAVVLNNSEEDEVIISRNTFQEGFMIGIHALGDNTVAKVSCNEFACLTGLMVFDANSPLPIFPNQGVVGIEAAGNTFVSGCNGANSYSDIYYAGQISSGGNTQFTYTARSTGLEIPTCYNTNVSVSVGLNLSNPCSMGSGEPSGRNAENQNSVWRKLSLDEGIDYSSKLAEMTIAYVPNLPILSEATIDQTMPAELMDWSVAPNPAVVGQQIKLRAFSSQSEWVQIRVIDLNGREIQTERSLVNQGWNEWQMQIKGVTTGVYLIELSTASHSGVKRLIIAD